MPQEFYARAKDKYHYRYPRGESYQVCIARALSAPTVHSRGGRDSLVPCQDIVARLEPVIHELMRFNGPVL